MAIDQEHIETMTDAELEELHRAIERERGRRIRADNASYAEGCELPNAKYVVPQMRVITPSVPCPGCGRDGRPKFTRNGTRYWCNFCRNWYDSDGQPISPNDV